MQQFFPISAPDDTKIPRIPWGKIGQADNMDVSSVSELSLFHFL